MRHVLAAVLFFCLSCAPASAATYRVAHAAEWPPFEFLNKNDAVVGYSVDYIQAVAREGGFSVVNLNIPWDGIFTRLDADEYQIIASSVTITEQRKKTMDFSLPYFTTAQRLILLAGSPVNGPEGLKNAVLAAQSGTTGQKVINTYSGTTAKLFDEVGQAVDDLVAGGVSGVICDEHVALHFAGVPEFKEKIALAPFSVSEEKEMYGFVVKKGNNELLQRINEGILAVQKKEIDKEIYTKWFGTGKPVH